MTCLFFRDRCILMAKSALAGTISSDDFFLEITGSLGQTLHYQGMTLSDDLFLRNHLESRTKIGLEYIQFYEPVLACQLHDYSQRSPHATSMLSANCYERLWFLYFWADFSMH